MSGLEFRHGDLFDADAEAFVNTVNCVGVMGRGVALQFKHRFPENFREYVNACKKELVQPGKMFTTERVSLGQPQYIINFPTKRHWKGKSRIEDIQLGLLALKHEIERLNIHSIALPPLGSGLGGLDWHDVRHRIEETLINMDGVQVIVYEPSSVAPTLRHVTSPPKITPGRAALVGLMDRYLGGLLDPYITLIEVQKLMYFLQAAGEDLKLNYIKGTYGPYADNLRHVLKRLEGHMIYGYGDGGENPDKPISLVAGARDDANRFLNDYPDTLDYFERVVDLIEGFETGYGMELLSTVHYVAVNGTSLALGDVIDGVHAWSEHKKQFSLSQITVAWETLINHGWLAPALPN